MSDAEGFETIEVAIPLWGALRCFACGSVAVDLNGHLRACTEEGCPMGTKVRELQPEERQRLEVLLRELQTHVEGCTTCQESTDNKKMCATGGALYGRWLAWLVPMPEGL